MASLKEDIEEFMGIPFEDVVKHVGINALEYKKKLWEFMFPWEVTKDNHWDYYRSDQYAALLFSEAVNKFEHNEPTMPQVLANLVDSYVTQPRILDFGCGNGMIALGLKGMNCNDITLAGVPNRYSRFLKFISDKYDFGFKFLPIDKWSEYPLEKDKKYEIIICSEMLQHLWEPEATLRHLVEHLEDRGYLYISANFDGNDPSCLEKNAVYQDTEKLFRTLEGTGLKGFDKDESGAWKIWRKVIQTPPEKPPVKLREAHIFPTSIACLSSLPGTACGIATYTQWLSKALSKHYPVNTFRDINSGVPEDALILASIEFGIFENAKMLLNEKYKNNWKFAVWHTVLRDPNHIYLKYVQDIDVEYDAHIVHTVVQKSWLSKYVSKPVYIIPHGTLLWDQVPKSEARRKLGLPEDAKIAFAFGFAAQNKGLDEVIEVAKRVKIPDFKFVISAGVHGIAVEHTEHLKEELKKRAENTNVMVIGRYLDEEEINLWASASDVLVFNYKTPPYVGSASGAMKRVLAAGKPIICVNDNRLEELVDGQHSLKFKQGDLDDFARVIETLLSDAEMAEKLGKNCRMLAEQTSWERAAEKYVDVFGTLISGFGPEYYDEAYFSGKHGGKKYVTQEGEVKEWSYYNPDGEWLGAQCIMEAVKELFNPGSMLSVGEGRGTFCAYAKDAGIDCLGIDFSRWAVENPYPRAKGLVQLGDVRDLKFTDSSFDLLFCSDIMEHIYSDDLPKAISEIQRVAKKWIFYNIGASMMGDEKGDLVVAKNSLPPKDRLTTTVAGHVTVKPESWWREKLFNDRWRLRDDLVAEFRRIVPAECLLNWKCVIIAEKVE